MIGFLFGVIPGISHVVSTFVSYAVEKRVSKRPEEFGHGAIAGVAGPETANNATTGSSLIPLLVLGIPAIPATAILLSSMLIHGVQPGPQLITDHPDVFWGLIASMLRWATWILLCLNLPLVGYCCVSSATTWRRFFLALVLGQRVELNFRRSRMVSDDDYGIFFAGTAVKVFIAALAIVVALQVLAWAFGYRKGIVEDPD